MNTQVAETGQQVCAVCSKGAQKTPTQLIGSCTKKFTEQAWPQFLEQYSKLTLCF